MPDLLRTFISLSVPKSILELLARVQQDLKAYRLPIRWVPPPNIHLTLKFLGDTRQQDIEPIAAAIADAVKGIEPIRLTVQGLGVFPNTRRPQVLWAGLGAQSDTLVGLQQRLEASLASLGFAKAQRRFKGHLTLGRVKGRIDRGRLSAAIQSCSGLSSESFEAHALFLMSSELQPSGAIYTRLKQFLLGGQPQP
jgi:2'-5' RNA ligase